MVNFAKTLQIYKEFKKIIFTNFGFAQYPHPKYTTQRLLEFFHGD